MCSENTPPLFFPILDSANKKLEALSTKRKKMNSTEITISHSCAMGNGPGPIGMFNAHYDFMKLGSTPLYNHGTIWYDHLIIRSGGLMRLNLM